MNEEKLLLPVLLGTNRKERKSGYAANWVFEQMKKRDEIETVFFDARDFNLPHDDYGTDIKDSFPLWRDTIEKADGLVIVTPEYNHGYPGILKSILDLLLKEYIHKGVGFVGVSARTWGGTRVIESMLPMVRELGLTAIFTDLNFPYIEKKFDESGKLLDTAYDHRVKDFLDELIWMCKILKWGRKNLPSKYHQ